MEVPAWQAFLGIRLQLAWAPREVNQHADDLTNGLFTAFSPDKQVAAAPGDVQFWVLTDFMKEAVDFYSQKKCVGCGPGARRGRGRPRLPACESGSRGRLGR